MSALLRQRCDGRRRADAVLGARVQRRRAGQSAARCGRCTAARTIRLCRGPRARLGHARPRAQRRRNLPGRRASVASVAARRCPIRATALVRPTSRCAPMVRTATRLTASVQSGAAEDAALRRTHAGLRPDPAQLGGVLVRAAAARFRAAALARHRRYARCGTTPRRTSASRRSWTTAATATSARQPGQREEHGHELGLQFQASKALAGRLIT